MYLFKLSKVSLSKIQKLTPAIFCRNFFLRSIYLQLLIIEAVFYIIPNVRSISSGLCCIRIFLSFFPSFFFLLLLLFSLTDTNDSQDSRDGTGNHCFPCFPLPPAHEHLVNRDFYHFFLINLFVITSLIANETSSPQRFAFYFHFH